MRHQGSQVHLLFSPLLFATCLFVGCSGGSSVPSVTSANSLALTGPQAGSIATGLASAPASTVAPVISVTQSVAYDPNSLVDSIGINERPAIPAVSQRPFLQGLRVRHVRAAVGILSGNASAISDAVSDCQNGMTLDLLTDRFHTVAQINSVISSLPANCIVSLEGPNENDNPGQGAQYDPNYATDLPAFMAGLHQAFPNYTILAPAMVSTQAYSNVGNVSSLVTFGNMHDYFGGFYPGIPNGWGGMVSPNPVCCYGSIAFNIANGQLGVPDGRTASTETGYCTATGMHGCVPLDVQARYVPRIVLDHWLAHVPFTYIFALQAQDATTADGTLGLVSVNGTPLPAYYALQSLIMTMQGTQPATDAVSVTGGDNSVRHVTMQSPDGHLHVAVWIEASSFDPNASGGSGMSLAVPSQQVTLTDGVATSPISVTTCDYANTGRCSSSQNVIVNGKFVMTATDSVTVVRI